MTNPGKALVLGATSGIGKEMAKWLADKGWMVGIAGRREKLLDEIRATRPDRFVSSVIDVDNGPGLIDGLDGLTERLGGVDLLVVCSGTGFLNPNLDASFELRTVLTNVAGFTVACDWGYNYFTKNGGGTLAAVTSVAGLIGEAAAPAYAASKSYQIQYLNGLRNRAAKNKANVAIVDLRPGSVQTEMMKGEGHFWISSPEKAADIACRAIMKKKKRQYISRRWRLIGFLLRLGAIFD